MKDLATLVIIFVLLGIVGQMDYNDKLRDYCRSHPTAGECHD